jgi:hypothetical protein
MYASASQTQIRRSVLQLPASGPIQIAKQRLVSESQAHRFTCVPKPSDC